MARFVRIWTARDSFLKHVVGAAEEADANRVKEYNAAVRIQSWFRGIRLRAYVKFMNKCAVMIQKHYRGFLGRKAYLKHLRECVQEMYERHYNAMATRIQCTWKGYYVRKYVFNYYAYKKYMEGLVKKNEAVRARLNKERERAIEERLNQEEKIQELMMVEEAKRNHYMLSTHCQDGVFSFQHGGSFEKTMQSIKFHQPSQLKSKRYSPLQKDTNSFTLPPLVQKCKVQGPFRAPEEVWRQRVKPLSPTLRVSTDYKSQEIARAELKAEEWRNRVIDEKFLPFSQRRRSYQSLLHTKSSFEKPAYGTRTFRVEKPVDKPFRTVVPPIPIFEKLNSTY